MAQQAEQATLDQVTVDSENNSVSVRFERSLYPLDSIYGAAYVHIDNCYVYLDVAGEDHLKVELRGRQPLEPAALEALAGEFANELLTQAWRHEISERNRLTIETVTLQALAGAAGQPPIDPMAGLADLPLDGEGADGGFDDLDDLDDLPEDLEDDVFDDPLGIAVPWEEKYGKEAEEGRGAQSAEPGAQNNIDAAAAAEADADVAAAADAEADADAGAEPEATKE